MLESPLHDVQSVITPSLACLFLLSPDFAYERLVEYQAQGKEDHAMEEGGEENPAQSVHGERTLVGIDAIVTEELDLEVAPCQLHQTITKAELGEDQEGAAQPLEEHIDGLQEGRTEQELLRSREEGGKEVRI